MSPLTLAPLPNLYDLLAAIFKRSASDDELASPWGRNDDITFLFSRSAWSLLAIACWNKHLFNKQDINVWIPDFFCNESLIPLREMGFNLIFYPVTTEMSPNFSACELLANKHPPNIFLLVHYFGRPLASDSVITFCKMFGSWLIEDATHVLRPIPGVGEIGDCVIYSPHKHLPIPDGAVLVVRKNGPGELSENNRAITLFHQVRSDIFSKKYNINYHIYLWLIKRTVQSLGFHVNLSKKIFRATIVEANIKALGHPKMHNISKCLLTNLFTKLDLVATRREQNAKNIFNLMTLAVNTPKFQPDIVQETPYLAAFFSTKILDTEIIFNFLKKCNLPISTWPDLPPEVINSMDAHKIAIELRRNRFYLPVHQSLSEFKLFESGKNILRKSTLQWHVRDLSYDEWNIHWKNCPETNLLQSWDYGEAKKNTDGWRIKHFLIEDHHEHPVAIAQVLTKAWPIFGGIARLNRGPLLLANHLNDVEVSLKLAALSVLLNEMRHRHFWFFQIAPEIKDSQFAHNTLRALGLRLQSVDAWASGLIDLNLSEDVLYNNLNRRWKRALRKSLDGGVIIENEELTFARLEDVLKSYKNLQVSNKFKGIDEALVKEMFMSQSNHWTINLFVAKKINKNGFYNDIGYRLCLYQGYTALDFIVSTNIEGVEMEASSSLYWHAILHAKQSGCRWFDIGGLNKSTPKGIAEFKNGLNANPYRLVGEWRKWF